MPTTSLPTSFYREFLPLLSSALGTRYRNKNLSASDLTYDTNRVYCQTQQEVQRFGQSQSQYQSLSSQQHQHPALKYGYPITSYVLIKEGYVVQFDPRTRNPLYVIEYVTGDDLENVRVTRGGGTATQQNGQTSDNSDLNDLDYYSLTEPTTVVTRVQQEDGKTVQTLVQQQTQQYETAYDTNQKTPVQDTFFEESNDLIPGRFRSRLQDYVKSGYDRGHQAPAANHRSNEFRYRDTFSMCNISPQVGVGMNRDY